MRVTPKELARRPNVTTAAITFISRRLEELGLLHRVDHPKDRRSPYLELTPEGHRSMLDVHRDLAEFLDAATGDRTAGTLSDFTTAMRMVAASAERRSPGQNVPARPSAVASEDPVVPQYRQLTVGADRADRGRAGAES